MIVTRVLSVQCEIKTVGVRSSLLTAATVMGCLAAAQASADTLTTGYLYTSGYGQSELFRYQYTYDETINTITAITP